MNQQKANTKLLQSILGITLILALGACTKEINQSNSGSVGTTSVADQVNCFATDLYNGGWTNNTPSESIPISCTHNNGLALTYECQINGGAWNPCTSSSTHTVPTPVSGPYDFRVRATDPNGTQGVSSLINWNTDLDDPIISSLTLVNNHPNNTQFSFTGDDAFPGSSTSSGFSKFQCKLDGVDATFTDCSSLKTYTGLSPSTNYTFHLKAIDNVGNETIQPPFNFTTLSNTSPGICTVIAPFPPSPSSSTNATLTYSCVVPPGTTVAQYECRVDGGPWTVCTGTHPTYNVTGLGNGPHTFDVRYIDSNGSPSAPSAPHTWVVDNSGPNVSISGVGFPSGGGSQLSFTSDDPNATYECQFVGVDPTFVPCTSSVHYPNGDVPGASYTFYVRATDPSGNSSTTFKTWTNGDWGAFPACNVDCGETKWVQRLCNVPSPSVNSSSTLAGLNCQGNGWKWCTRTCTTYKIVNEIYPTTQDNLCAWNQDCQHSDMQTVECTNGMQQYCAANPWWNAAWGAVNVVGQTVDVACMTDDITEVIPVATNQITTAGCDPDDGYTAACLAVAQTECVNAGHTTGYGALLNNDNASFSIVCMEAGSGEMKNTSFTGLAGFNGACSSTDPNSTACHDAMTQYCQSLDPNFKTGIGPYNVSGGNLDVYCVYHEITI